MPAVKTAVFYGGVPVKKHLELLETEHPNVIVGTPGRVMDHMRQGTLDLSGLRSLVLDEADEMLRMGFIDDVEWVLGQLPEQRQVVLFSATMPSEIRRISHQYLNDPAEITIKTKGSDASRIRQRFITVNGPQKLEALSRVLEAETKEGVIIFARTKAITVTVAEALEAKGYDVAVLNGDVAQNQRERTIERLKNGTVDVLVATDVAARGLDIDDLPHVINYELPHVAEDYVHRIGRTGRAGASGEAISLVASDERPYLADIERLIKRQIPRVQVPGFVFDARAVTIDEPRPPMPPRRNPPRSKPAQAGQPRKPAGNQATGKPGPNGGAQTPRPAQRPQQRPAQGAGKPHTRAGGSRGH